MTPWKKGMVLLTPTTKTWTKEEWERANQTEEWLIFSDFVTKDDKGTGRKLVCRVEPSHPDAEENRKIILSAQSVRAAAEKILHLHLCEQEGMVSGQPSPQEWFEAVNKLSESLK